MSGIAGWKDINPAWEQVDDLIEAALLAEDAALEFAIKNCVENELPDIAVSPAQGKFLQFLVQVSGAKRVLEIGTLGAYSTIWLARGAGPQGSVVTIETEQDYACVARENLKQADLSARVDVRVGAALDVLELLSGPFDFAFIDADKVNNCNYVDHALRLSSPGAIIVVDNVVRQGDILQPQDESALGTVELYKHLTSHPRLDATAVQTVGPKGWDGMLFATVT